MAALNPSGSRIAILGAGGQIARGLIEALNTDNHLYLFTERPERLRKFLMEHQPDTRVVELRHTQGFGKDPYDLIVNAASPGDPKAIRSLGAGILRACEAVDNMVLDYLNPRPRCKLIFLSTGAIYGNAYDRPANLFDAISFQVNQPDQTPYYALSKMVAEAKHRSLASLSILDVRVFGYVSQELPIDGGFFLSEVANALVSNRPLMTNSKNFLRDFVGPAEIANCVRYALSTPTFNRAIDLVSPEAISKKRILSLANECLGLRYRVESGGDINEEVDCEINADNPDWPRVLSNLAMNMPGFEPARSSSEVIIAELSSCLRQHQDINRNARLPLTPPGPTLTI